MPETSALPRSLVGRAAPEFTLEASGGQHVDSHHYHGRWLVLLFYPHDFTFVCPTEIIGFSARLSEFLELNTDVLAVSTDSVYTHDAWIRTPVADGGVGDLLFPLAADVTHAMSVAYGVYDPATGSALRALFIIDPDGVVQYEVVHNLSVGRNVAETLRVLQGIQSGGLCPLNWRPGEPLLKV